MACTAYPVEDPAGPTEGKGLYRERTMTRCECAGLPFAEIHRQLREGQTLEAVSRHTGCGRLCTACIPDLEAYLHAASIEPGTK
jgi:bacterioferritin-associated ferredoxin